jgi:sulfur relay (sulfurtransferase) complex TusBCD TusD component (DsrE family)|uniref:Uncharacterized protein n=1 Tax=Leptospirillum ferriphilum TaxID=178606 RepID=A0A7C3QU55_9BACT
MARYLIVASRDITEYTNGQSLSDLSENLRTEGADVFFFLIENGVISARKDSREAIRLSELSGRGIRVMADDVSCRARGIDRLHPGIELSSMDELADAISEGFGNIYWY